MYSIYCITAGVRRNERDKDKSGKTNVLRKKISKLNKQVSVTYV